MFGLKRLIFVLMLALTLPFATGCNEPATSEQPTPPLPPDSLTAEVVSETEIILHWVDKSDNEDGFSILESIGEPASFRRIFQTAPSAQSVSLGRRTPATTYYYAVQSFNAGGTAASDTIQVSTLATLPTAPNGLNAVIAGRGEVRLEWRDNSANESGFQVFSCEDDFLDFNLIAVTTRNEASYTVRSLAGLTLYRFKVRAFNNFGESEFSDIVPITTPFAGILAVSAEMGEGLRVFDLTNPASPRLIGQASPQGRAEDVVIRDSLAYVAYWDQGLRVFDLTDPSEPRLIGNCAFQTAYRIALWQNLICIANYSSLEIIDVSHPTQPAQVGAFQGGVSYVTTARGFAYTSTIQALFQIIDLATPATPRERGSFRNNSIDFRGVALYNRYAYVASSGGSEFGSLQVFDVFNPDAVQFISLVREPPEALDLCVAGHYLYLAAQGNGLYIFDLSNPALPVLTSHFDTSGETRKAFVFEHTACLADGTGGLLILDVSDPVSPWLLSRLPTGGQTRSVYVADWR